MKCGVWACTVLAAAIIASVAPALGVQSSVVDQDPVAEEGRGAVPPKPSRGEGEIEQPDEKRARETGNTSTVTGKEPQPAEEPPEGAKPSAASYAFSDDFDDVLSGWETTQHRDGWGHDYRSGEFAIWLSDTSSTV